MNDALPLLAALVRFRFTKDLLVDDPASLSPRAYTAPFTYDLKLPVARLAVAGAHGEIVEVHGPEDDDDFSAVLDELAKAKAPPPPASVDLPPPVPTPPTSDAVVVAAAKALEPAAPPPPAPPTSDAVVAASLLKE
jgi:hypothetical protein